MVLYTRHSTLHCTTSLYTALNTTLWCTSLRDTTASLHDIVVQSMLDSPGREWEEGELPPVTGGFTSQQISEKVMDCTICAVL